MLNKKILTITMTITLCLVSSNSYANEKKDSYNKQLNAAKSDIKNTQNKIENAKNKQNDVMSEVAQIEANINSIQVQVDNQNIKLNELEKEYKFKKEGLEKLKIEYEKNYKIFEKQLVSSYTSSFEDSYSKVIFEATTLSDFIIGNTYFKYLLDDKDVKLQSLDENMAQQNKILEEIEKNKKETEDVKKNLDSKRQSLESQQQEYQKQIQGLGKEVNDLSVVLDAQNREASQVSSQISKLQEELYISNSSALSTQPTTSPVKPTTTSSVQPTATSDFAWPTKTKRMTSKYGYRIHPVTGQKKMHTGIDLGERMGAPIYASKQGTVIYSDWRGGYGKVVIIDHGDYISTLYAHLSELHVNVGQKVSKGQQVGAMGSTGMSTGPHLHFEVRKSGQHQNPINYLK